MSLRARKRVAIRASGKERIPTVASLPRDDKRGAFRMSLRARKRVAIRAPHAGKAPLGYNSHLDKTMDKQTMDV